MNIVNVFDDGWRMAVVTKVGRKYAYLTIYGTLSRLRVRIDSATWKATHPLSEDPKLARRMAKSITSRAKQLTKFKRHYSKPGVRDALEVLKGIA